MTKLDDTFDRLDRWRHLPDYQMERRADVFFSLYLREAVAAHVGCRLASTLVPEFPIAKRLLEPDIAKRDSIKVDYLLLEEGGQRAFLVELKTDMRSRASDGGREQCIKLHRAAGLGLARLLHGVRQIAQPKGNEKWRARKYARLLRLLHDAGVLDVPSAVEDLAGAERSQELSAALRNVVVKVPDDVPVQVVYVQPNRSAGHGVDEIDFHEFAAVVLRDADPLGQRFARSLHTWAQADAGDVAGRSR